MADIIFCRLAHRATFFSRGDNRFSIFWTDELGRSGRDDYTTADDAPIIAAECLRERVLHFITERNCYELDATDGMVIHKIEFLL